MFGRDEKVSQIRLTAVQYGILVLFFVLAYGFWRLQVSRNDYYDAIAQQNRIRQVPILAPRGKILDREGRIIVDNYPSFSALLLRDQVKDLDKDVEKIAAGLHLDPEELRTRIKRMAGMPSYQPSSNRIELSSRNSTRLLSIGACIQRADSWRTLWGMWARSAKTC
jgi:penicillin-binding protein 2